MTTKFIVCYDNEAKVSPDLQVGDEAVVVRGNGMREGEMIGYATITGIAESGGISFDLHMETTGPKL